MIVSTSAECSSAIILILPIAYNGARLPGPAKDFDKHSVINVGTSS
jgi:hypothetical protein